jgi:hypothetical protein
MFGGLVGDTVDQPPRVVGPLGRPGQQIGERPRLGTRRLYRPLAAEQRHQPPGRVERRGDVSCAHVRHAAAAGLVPGARDHQVGERQAEERPRRRRPDHHGELGNLARRPGHCGERGPGAVQAAHRPGPMLPGRLPDPHHGTLLVQRCS